MPRSTPRGREGVAAPRRRRTWDGRCRNDAIRRDTRRSRLSLTGRTQNPHFSPNILGSTTMKLLRYGPEGEERPGLLDDEDAIRDLSGVVSDIAGDVLTDAGLARVRAVDPASLPLVPGDPRIGPCVGNIG